MKTDPRVQLKQEVLNDGARAARKRHLAGVNGVTAEALTGDQWYSQEAMRAVNQAIGRVIRHRHDYGVGSRTVVCFWLGPWPGSTLTRSRHHCCHRYPPYCHALMTMTIHAGGCAVR